MGEVAIEISTKMKYLGIILDSRLSFKDHFDMVEGKAAKISRALCRVMPNLRGPSEFKRKLYVEPVKSVILYGAPIWSEELQRSREAMRGLDRVMRTLALRAISAYRTVSLDAASLLARIPPLHLMARERQRVFMRLRDLKDSCEWSKDAVKNIRKEEALLLKRQWSLYLQRTNAAGKHTREAILPCFNAWLERRHGGMCFRLTQVLTGHGCFAFYLHRIGKEESPNCNHCNEGMVNTPWRRVRRRQLKGRSSRKP